MGRESSVPWVESGEDNLQGQLESCHPKKGGYVRKKAKITSVPYRRGLGRPKEELDVGGQRLNSICTELAILSLWPLILVASRPQELTQQ